MIDVEELLVPSKKKRTVEGTHLGSLSMEARHARAVKNARNRSRSGQATRPKGSERKSRCIGSRRRR